MSFAHGVNRYGAPGIVIAKFLPGLSLLAPPLAGSSGMKPFRFLFLATLGSLLYSASFALVGVLFSHRLTQIIAALGHLGGDALGLAAGLLLIYLAYKYLQRRRLLSDLGMARITADELYQKMEAGENPVILDVRSLGAVQSDPVLIRGARHMTVEEVETRHVELPRDREIVLYCSCPNEASAAYVALALKRRGIQQVRPLLDGIDGWRERNYPTQPLAFQVTEGSGNEQKVLAM